MLLLRCPFQRNKSVLTNATLKCKMASNPPSIIGIKISNPPPPNTSKSHGNFFMKPMMFRVTGTATELEIDLNRLVDGNKVGNA